MTVTNACFGALHFAVPQRAAQHGLMQHSSSWVPRRRVWRYVAASARSIGVIWAAPTSIVATVAATMTAVPVIAKVRLLLVSCRWMMRLQLLLLLLEDRCFAQWGGYGNIVLLKRYPTG